MNIKTGAAVGVATAVLGAGCFTAVGEPVLVRDAGGNPDSGPLPDAGPPTYCTIGGFKYADSAPNPLNSCQSCQLALSTNDWSSLALGTRCAVSGLCHDGACNQGCVIDGGFVYGGTTDTGGCLICSAAASEVSWTALPDGTICGPSGTPDICFAGTCQPGCVIAAVLYAPDDLNALSPCQACKPFVSTSQWSELPAGSPCLDGGVCASRGACLPPFNGCTVGSVQVPNRASNPADPSLCCNAAANPFGWSPRFVDGGAFVATAFDPNEAYLHAGDFSGNGFSDLALDELNQLDKVIVFLNQQGSLIAGATYPVGGDPRAMVAVDLNRDGLVDLVTENSTDQTISVLMSRGDGTFDPAVTYTSCGAGAGSLAAADFNGDGIPDIVSACGVLLAGIGDGGFHTGSSLPVGSAAGQLAVGDFNGDGTIDLAVNDTSTGDLSIALGNGKGGFSLGTRLATMKTYGWRMVAGDFDGDGHVDLALSPSNWDHTLTFLKGLGDGTFAAPVSIPLAGTPGSIAVTDLAGDGRKELLVSNGSTVGQLVFVDGGPALATMVSSYLTFDEAEDPAVADFNNDRALDFAALANDSAGQQWIAVYLNGCP
jgi:hypothetical protein